MGAGQGTGYPPKVFFQSQKVNYDYKPHFLSKSNKESADSFAILLIILKPILSKLYKTLRRISRKI